MTNSQEPYTSGSAGSRRTRRRTRGSSGKTGTERPLGPEAVETSAGPGKHPVPVAESGIPGKLQCRTAPGTGFGRELEAYFLPKTSTRRASMTLRTAERMIENACSNEYLPGGSLPVLRRRGSRPGLATRRGASNLSETRVVWQSATTTDLSPVRGGAVSVCGGTSQVPAHPVSGAVSAVHHKSCQHPAG